MIRTVPALALISLIWAFAPEVHAASFDCKKPDLTADEATICATPDLSEADVKMATMYDLISGLFAMGTRGDMQDRQNQWIDQRKTCGTDIECLRRAYEQRILQLDEIYKQIPKPL